MTVGFYPGSFDPFTNGHLDVVRQALRVCSHLVIAVGRHASKAGGLDYGTRAALIRASLAGESRFEVRSFDGLAVDAAHDAGAQVMVRGIRDGADLAYEMQLAGMNAGLAPELQTVFLPARPGTQHITATLVRQIDAMGGDVKPFVPPPVHAFMIERRGRSEQS